MGGAIVQSRESRNRMVFIESESLDPLFHGIEKLIGMPIELAVIAARRRAVMAYLDSLLPEVTKGLLGRRGTDWRPINEGLITRYSEIVRLRQVRGRELSL
jgi:hypothetical protein